MTKSQQASNVLQRGIGNSLEFGNWDVVGTWDLGFHRELGFGHWDSTSIDPGDSVRVDSAHKIFFHVGDTGWNPHRYQRRASARLDGAEIVDEPERASADGGGALQQRARG